MSVLVKTIILKMLSCNQTLSIQAEEQEEIEKQRAEEERVRIYDEW